MPFRAVIAAILIALSAQAAQAKDLVVFAAASTVEVMGAVANAWAEDGGPAVRTAYASSGALARQIEAGAPADVFLSANVRWVDHLVSRGAVRPETRFTAFHNSLVLIAPAGSAATAALDPTTGTYRALASGARIALGDPDHVPAGIYAREALTELGTWAATASHTVRMQNVRLALAVVERHEAALGIVYGTDALKNSRVRVVQRFAPDLHTPIRYVAVETKSADPGAAAFLRFLRSGRATEIFRRHGFITD